MRTHLQESAIYDSATAEAPLTETDKTVLPVTINGMRSRKRALRELRCVPAWAARELAKREESATVAEPVAPITEADAPEAVAVDATDEVAS